MESITVHNLLLFLPSLESGTTLTREGRQWLFRLVIDNAKESEGLMVLQAIQKYVQVDYAGFADCAREYLARLSDEDTVKLVSLILRGLDDPEVENHELAAAFKVAKMASGNIAFVLLMPLVEHVRPGVMKSAMENPTAFTEYFDELFNSDYPP